VWHITSIRFPVSKQAGRLSLAAAKPGYFQEVVLVGSGETSPPAGLFLRSRTGSEIQRELGGWRMPERGQVVFEMAVRIFLPRTAQ